MTRRRGGTHSSIQIVSSATSSPSAVIRNVTEPLVGSPVQTPIQRPSRSDSVTAAQTSSMGARNVLSKTR